MQLRELMVDIEAGRMPRKAVASARSIRRIVELAVEAGISADAMRMQRDRSVATIQQLEAA